LVNLNERGSLIYIGSNIKIDLEKVGYGLDSSGSGQRLVVGFCEIGNEFFLTGWVTVKFTMELVHIPLVLLEPGKLSQHIDALRAGWPWFDS
jgi:hypothetical protein